MFFSGFRYVDVSVDGIFDFAPVSLRHDCRTLYVEYYLCVSPLMLNHYDPNDG